MLVSVIMPTYNCGKFISQSLDSVISQTVSDWEVQIVDDCSTDNTAEVLKPYLEKYPNIHYYVLPKNGGPAIARTEAIKRATGKYVAFLDSDDLWMPNKLQSRLNLWRKQELSLALLVMAGWMRMEMICTLLSFRQKRLTIKR